MLDVAHEVLEFSTGKSRSDLDIDRMLNLSLVHLLEIIGEAAVDMSPGFRKKYPQVPWNAIVGMRICFLQQECSNGKACIVIRSYFYEISIVFW